MSPTCFLLCPYCSRDGPGTSEAALSSVGWATTSIHALEPSQRVPEGHAIVISMDTKLITSPRRLSDSELIERVKDLAGRERRVTASLVAHLAELDERRLHVAEGCCSLFAYCTEVLHFSEGAAYNRIKAARAARKFPLVLDKLAGGSVHLATVRLLAPFLTEENYRDLLDEATHKTRQQVEKIIARLRPLPPIATSVRKVCTRVAANNGGAANDVDNAPGIDFSRAADDPVRHPQPVSSSIIIAKPAEEAAGQASLDVRTGNSPIPAREPQRAKVAPLSPDVYRIQFAVDADTYTALGQARELLRHQIPDGDAARVIGLALKVLVKKLTAQKLGAGKIRRHTDTHRTNLRDAAHEPKRVQ